MTPRKAKLSESAMLHIAILFVPEADADPSPALRTSVALKKMAGVAPMKQKKGNCENGNAPRDPLILGSGLKFQQFRPIRG